MDPATAKLAIELQLADIDELLDGIYETLPPGDQRAGYEMMQQDLQRQLQILEGQILTLKILKEEHGNRAAFVKLLEVEKQAVSDHQLAMRLAGMSVNHPEVKNCADYEASLCGEQDCGTDEQWEMAKELYSAAIDSNITDLTSFNSTRVMGANDVKGRAKDKDTARVLEALCRCDACMEDVLAKNTLTLDCKPDPHVYCRTCLIDLFKSSIQSSSLFPPRCCKVPMPLETCRILLPRQLVKEFDLKVEELANPNPTFCSNANCAKFIRVKEIKNDSGTCVFCKTKTCVVCKGEGHTGLCPKDPHVQLLMDVAKRSKWQQCSKCKNMIELSHGCFHMM